MSDTSSFDLDFPRAFSQLDAAACFRSQPEDFFVDESLGFELSGTGEHVCLHIEKREQNTVWVAKQLAEQAGIQQKDVGYCGLKDRHAVTRQWFSLYVGNRDVLPASLAVEGCSILAVTRHEKKLRPGMHAANRFAIRLRDVQGDRDGLSGRLNDIACQGVPNYFGEQRFGIDGSNLIQAQKMSDMHPRVWREHKHQFVVSAVRSCLFNAVLAERVRSGNWRERIDGDAITPDGPLWGRGRPLSGSELAALEADVLAPYAIWRDKLEHVGLQQERRPLLLIPQDVSAVWQTSDWIVQFSLPPGTYATAVLRELMHLQQPVR